MDMKKLTLNDWRVKHELEWRIMANQNKWINITHGSIAGKTSLHRSSVWRALQHLHELHIIVYRHRKRDGAHGNYIGAVVKFTSEYLSSAPRTPPPVLASEDTHLSSDMPEGVFAAEATPVLATEAISTKTKRAFLGGVRKDTPPKETAFQEDGRGRRLPDGECLPSAKAEGVADKRPSATLFEKSNTTTTPAETRKESILPSKAVPKKAVILSGRAAPTDCVSEAIPWSSLPPSAVGKPSCYGSSNKVHRKCGDCPVLKECFMAEYFEKRFREARSEGKYFRNVRVSVAAYNREPVGWQDHLKLPLIADYFAKKSVQ